MNAPTLAKVLIVDDNPANLLLTQEILKDLGHSIIAANSGQEAIDLVKKNEFALIILDVKMPNMNGFEVATRIQEYCPEIAIPILFMTGCESQEIDIFNGYEVGAVDYLIKPIKAKILKSKVSVFIQLYQQQKQLQQQTFELEEMNQNLQEQILECRNIENKLYETNLQLEKRVQERTQKLEKINHSLKLKIKESRRLHKECRSIEQQIRDSELLHRTILHNISDAVFVTDTQGYFTFICPNSDVIFGYDYEEIQKINNIHQLLGKNLLEGYDLEDLEEINNLEHEIIDKFNCHHFLLVNIKKVSISQGTILYTFRDITERKQAQLALQKRQCYLAVLTQLQQQLLTAIPENIFDEDLLEPLATVTQANRIGIYQYKTQNNQDLIEPKIKWCISHLDSTISGCHLQPLILNHVFSSLLDQLKQGEVISGIVEDLPPLEKELLEAENIKSFLILPLRVMGKFYGFIEFDDCLNEKHWDSLEVSILRSVAAAISLTLERSLISQELQSSQNKLLSIVNNTSDGLIVVDQQGIIQFLNPTAEHLFSLSQEQLSGKYLGFLSGKKGTEIQIHHIGGNMITTEMRVTDILWDNQPASLASLRDITQNKQIEEELQTSLRELSAMKYALDQASIVAITDKKGVITYVNDKFCQISQYSPEELIGTKHGKGQNNYHSPQFWQQLWQTISKGEIWRGEIRNQAKDGHFYWLDTTIVPFLDLQGQPEKYLAIRFDITDRKLAEQTLQALNEDLEVKIAERTERLAESNEKLRQEILEREKAELALRESQEKLQDLFDNANDLIQSISLENGRFLYVNQAWYRTLGYSPEELDNLRIFDLIASSYLEHYFQLFDQMKKGEIQRIDHVEVALVSKTYQTVILEGSINCRWENGQPAATRAIFRDITEQKRIQKAIEASEAQFRAIFDNAAVGIALGTVEGRVIQVNSAFIEMLGYSEDKILQMHFADFTHPEDLQDELHAFQALLRGERDSYQMEKRYICANGQIVWGHLTVSLVYKNFEEFAWDYHENNCFVVGIVEDVSERVIAEKEIQKALMKERELNELKSQFIDIVSHEFRTPLTSILGYTELLINYYDKFSQEKRHKHLERISIAGKQMKILIEDVLCLSRVESGKVKFEPQPLDIIDFCQELVEEFQIGIGKNHEFQLYYDSDLLMIHPCLDKKLLHHILSNLISNSIKYSKPQHLIELSLEKQNQFLVFFVKDQGIGIPIPDQVHLFESFHRAENVGDIQGTGLGLNIVQRYVNLHQGNIIFSSTINEGTIFRVALPVNNTELSLVTE